jgi:hypothetical protein
MSISEVLRERVLDPLPVLSEPLWPVDPEIFRKRCRIHGLGELPHSPANPLPLGLSRSGWRDLNSLPLDPQTSAACPWMSPHVQISLKIRILHIGAFRWTNQMVVKMVVKPIAKLSAELIKLAVIIETRA